MIEVLGHGLIWGLILTAYLSISFVALAFINPEMWLNDYPPDIRKRFGPMSPRANRQRWLLGVPIMVVTLGIMVFGTMRFAEQFGSPGFGNVFLHTLVMLMVFNLIDLLVIDWLVMVRLQPRFVVLPGTEGMAGYKDYGFHWRAFLKGTVGIAVVSAIVATITVLID